VLVLIDGRSVYTPLFAGVFWSLEDTLLEDIERIEVIRGPGGTIWGANAVNGVVNIITKNAKDSHGPLATVSGGNIDQGISSFRYGSGNNENVDYRFYGKFFSRGAQFHPDNRPFDTWRTGQAGFRADWSPSNRDHLTIQGDIFKGGDGQRVGIASFSPPSQTNIDQVVNVSGGNLQAQWRRELSSGSDVQIQAYYDRTDLLGPQFEETRNTFDIDFIHHQTLPGQQSFIWGLGARVSPSSFGQTIPTLDFIPHQKTNSIYSEFVQDEIPMVRNKLSLTVGAKLEHNNYTGFEVQPSARVLWTISQQQTFWAAVTRAVRTPSRIEEDFKLTGFLLANPLIFVEIDGNRNLVPERLIGYEAGYRKLITPQLYLDFVVFHNDYDDLVSLGSATISADPTPPPPHFTIHFPWTNGIKGTTDGFEIAPDWKPCHWWQMKSTYSYLNLDLSLKPGNSDTGSVSKFEGSSPHNQLRVQSQFNLPKGFEFDQTYRYVSALPAQLVESYHSVDTRFAWRLQRDYEFSFVGQNLLQPQHAEFGRDPGPMVGIRRSMYAKITWQRTEN